jgi:CheY-like chemotaxis protein
MTVKNGKPVLMVLDDDDAVRQTWTIIFRQQGYEVVPADRGTAAIDAARDRAPDLLLADIRLPDMTGIEASRRVKEIAPACHVLLISGDSDSGEAIEEARARGAIFEVLPKPISPPDLIRRIADLLRNHQP